MPEFPITSARILLVSQIQGGRLPPCHPVRYAYDNVHNIQYKCPAVKYDIIQYNACQSDKNGMMEGKRLLEI